MSSERRPETSPGMEGPAPDTGCWARDSPRAPAHPKDWACRLTLTLEPWDGLVFLGSERRQSGIVGNMG